MIFYLLLGVLHPHVQIQHDNGDMGRAITLKLGRRVLSAVDMRNDAALLAVLRYAGPRPTAQMTVGAFRLRYHRTWSENRLDHA